MSPTRTKNQHKTAGKKHKHIDLYKSKLKDILNAKRQRDIKMLFNVVVLLSCFLVAKTNKMSFDYHISEGEARFDEHIETDLQRKLVRYDVPAHNDVWESHKLQNFKVGKQMTCIPKLKKCKLRDIDTKHYPNAENTTEAFLWKWRNGQNSISSETSVKVTENYVADKEILNTVSLSADLQNFLKEFNFPLYQERKILDSEIRFSISKTISRRQKRQSTILDPCNNNQQPYNVYAVSASRSCNYLILCGDVVNGVLEKCDDIHISTPGIFYCLVCPEVTDVNNCGTKCACHQLY